MSVANSSTASKGSGGRVGVGLYRVAGGAIEMFALARITEWSISCTVTEDNWSDSDSGGYTNSMAGRRHSTGSIGGKLDKDVRQHTRFLFNDEETDPQNCDVVTLVLWENADEDATETGYHWVLPRAVITNYQQTFDVDNRGSVAWSADFSADGKFYKPGDSSRPTIVYANMPLIGTGTDGLDFNVTAW